MYSQDVFLYSQPINVTFLKFTPYLVYFKIIYLPSLHFLNISASFRL